MEKKHIRKTLIFDIELGGHHLEYIHHLYLGAVSRTSEQYIFAIPEDFREHSEHRYWPDSSNIMLYYLKNTDTINNSNLIISSYKACKLLSNTIKVVKPDVIVLITLMQFLPFIPLFIPNKIRVSGIIYMIYLYRWKNLKIIEKALNIIKYLIITKSSVFHSIYILNDSASAIYLNKLYNTKKFKYLPDPLINIKTNLNIYPQSNFRNTHSLPDKDIVLLHFGSLSERKGTIEILKSIPLIKAESREHYHFVFAGKISPEIYKIFFEYYETMKHTSNIYVYDKFCSYEFLDDLCSSSDFILIPYLSTYLSSGVLGYSAIFEKPVIGPRSGLLGKLIRKYKLGFTLDEISATSLSNLFNSKKLQTEKIQINATEYRNRNSVSKFVQTILN